MKKTKLFGTRIIENIQVPRTPNIIMFDNYDSINNKKFDQGDLLDANSIKKIIKKNGTDLGIYHDEQGHTHVSADVLEARVKAIFPQLEVRKLSFTSGDVGYTSAGCKVTKVIKQSNGDYRCYFLAESDGVKISNAWHVGDQAMCRTSNIISKATQMAQNRYYWRLVVGIGEEALEDGKLYHFIDLSNTAGTVNLNIGGKGYTCVGYDTSVVNDEPKVEDSLVQLGSQTDPDRQYAYIVYSSTGERVDYNGVNDYNLSSHITTKMGVHGTTVRSEYFEILGPTGVSTPLVSERGAWNAGETYGHYDHVSYNNATWLCNVGKGNTTTEEPTDGSTVWIKETDGADGKSAYDVAKSNGFVGSETEWLASLKGEKVDGITPMLRRGYDGIECSTDNGNTWIMLANFTDLGFLLGPFTQEEYDNMNAGGLLRNDSYYSIWEEEV